MTRIFWDCSVTIFSEKEKGIQYAKREYPLFDVLLKSCEKEEGDSFVYETSYYPVYLMVKKYFEILHMDFMEIKYKR